MSEKMSNAPIYFALAQVRFSAVLALENFLPAIQESFRRNGYPDFERLLIATINFAVGGEANAQSSPMPTMQPQPRLVFSNENRTASFLLDQATLTFQTTSYDTYDAFSREFMKGAEFVHRAATLSLLERVGIRYLDAILPLTGETLDKYLAPGVMGVYDGLAPRMLEHAISETRTKQSNTTLVSRVAIMHRPEKAPVAFPPDLTGNKMALPGKFNSVRGTYAVLDTDSWLEERERFTLPSLKKRLDALHDELRRSFDLTVTQPALEAWK